MATTIAAPAIEIEIEIMKGSIRSFVEFYFYKQTLENFLQVEFTDREYRIISNRIDRISMEYDNYVDVALMIACIIIRAKSVVAGQSREQWEINALNLMQQIKFAWKPDQSEDLEKSRNEVCTQRLKEVLFDRNELTSTEYTVYYRPYVETLIAKAYDAGLKAA